MQNLKEKFLKIYANIPLNLRDQIILTLGEEAKPITWDVAFFEINNDTDISKGILKKLSKIKLI